MDELIRITQQQDGRKAVSARELYDKLGFDRSQWARWYQKNIIGNEFAIENQDWQGFDTVSNGNTTKDFVLSLDFAKRLSMMARTESGEAIRNYFIEVEKQSAMTAEKLINDPDFAIQILTKLKQERAEKEMLLIANSELAPKAKTLDGIFQAPELVTTTTIAKDLGMTARQLNKVLHDKRVQFKQNNVWTLYREYQDKGYARYYTHPFTDNDGRIHTIDELRWTQTGKRFIMGVVAPVRDLSLEV